MGNNMVPYAFAIEEKCTNFIYNLYKFIENDKIEEGTLLNRSNDSLDPYDYHFGKCGENSFKKLEYSFIHTLWPGVREDIENEDGFLGVEDEVEEHGDLIETQNLNATNEVVKILNQRCVICYERDSVYAFRQYGHQCICEQCYQKG